MATFETMFNASSTSDFPEGAYEARLTALDITSNNPILGEDLEANWEFQVLSGSEEGKTFRHRQRLTMRSFPFFKNNLVVASGRKSFSAADLYDSATNQSGPLVKALVGSVVRIAVVHKESRGSTFVNINVVERVSGPFGSAS
jgi:hypothetical protein